MAHFVSFHGHSTSVSDSILPKPPVGFVSMNGEWKAPSVEHTLRRNRIGAQDRRRIEKEQKSARVSMVLLSLRNDVLFRVHRRGSCSSGTRAPTGERPPDLSSGRPAVFHCTPWSE